MIPPAGVARGWALAADELRISPHSTIAFGDAENDHALLDAAELAVALADAVPALKSHADLTHWWQSAAAGLLAERLVQLGYGTRIVDLQGERDVLLADLAERVIELRTDGARCTGVFVKATHELMGRDGPLRALFAPTDGAHCLISH